MAATLGEIARLTRQAASSFGGVIQRTPVMTSSLLDGMTNEKKLYFKCEHLQKSGSFKLRGALWAVTRLLEAKGVDPADVTLVTESSGNFGIGLSLAARTRGIGKVTVLVRKGSSPGKREIVRSYGGTIMEHVPTDEGLAEAIRMVESTGARFMPADECHNIISGVGTVGLELMEQVPDLDAVVVPVSGGGLVSGIGAFAKSINPNIKIIAAELAVSNSCERSLAAGDLRRVPLSPELARSCVADGLVTSIGEKTWPIIRETVDDVITVKDDEIKHATRLVWHYLKQCVEPSAGAALAAVLNRKFLSSLPPEVKNVGVILTGGNVPDTAKIQQIYDGSLH